MKHRNMVPPFIFPEMTFKRLIDSIKILKTKIELVDSSVSCGKLISYLEYGIDAELEGIMDTAIRFQDLLVQRTAGIEAFDNTDYHVNFQIEYSGLTKVFNAVDALAYELVKRTMGPEWIDKNKYVPISVFGRRNYSISPHTHFIYLPYYDCFRSKSWAALAHEVAHVFYGNHFERRYDSGFWEIEPETKEIEDFQIVVLTGIRDLHELCFGPGSFDENNPRDTSEQIAGQIGEIVCDTLSAYICGPASFFTFSEIIKLHLLPLKLVKEGISLEKAVAHHLHHPPFDVRLIASSSSLEFTHILSWDKDLEQVIKAIKKLCKEKNNDKIRLPMRNKKMTYSLKSSEKDFLREYMRLTRIFVWDLLESIDQMDLGCFTKDEWIKVNESLENRRIRDLTPVQFTNLVWLKRFSIIATEKDESFERYREKRSSEEKIFEEMVDCGYRYYEKEIYKIYREILKEGDAE